ncbi:sulfate ABC transporter substrate-binding protein, partial [Acinetobacter baumannii]|nr:sulfate ABC transporter substrate-binding protein [Acinetobacter baumannii]
MRDTTPNTLRRSLLALVLAAGSALPLHASAADVELLNVSY